MHTPYTANATSQIPLNFKCYNIDEKLQSHGDSTIKFRWYLIWSFVLVRSGVAVRGGSRVYSRWKTSFQCWLLGFYIQLNCNESMLNRKRFSRRFSTYQKRMKMTFNCVSNRPFRHFSVDGCLLENKLKLLHEWKLFTRANSGVTCARLGLDIVSQCVSVLKVPNCYE